MFLFRLVVLFCWTSHVARFREIIICLCKARAGAGDGGLQIAIVHGTNETKQSNRGKKRRFNGRARVARRVGRRRYDDLTTRSVAFTAPVVTLNASRAAATPDDRRPATSS